MEKRPGSSDSRCALNHWASEYGKRGQSQQDTATVGFVISAAPNPNYKPKLLNTTERTDPKS